MSVAQLDRVAARRDLGRAAGGRRKAREHGRRHVGHHQFPPAHLERQDVVEASRRGQAAPGDDGDTAAERFGVGKDVGAEEDRPPLVAQLEDERPDLAAAERVEARHRLVEKDDFGIVDERLGNADALHHPLRELPQLQPALGADPDAIEKRRHPLGAIGGRIPEQLREIAEQLLGGQVVVEVGILRKVADALARRDVPDRLTRESRPDRTSEK